MTPPSVPPPPPDGQVLSLVAALSSAENHALHLEAIKARDEALSSSPETYGSLCTQLAYLMVGSDRPADMIRRMDPAQLDSWRHRDPSTAMRLQQDESLWTAFGQLAGLILKQALLRPPTLSDGRPLYLVSPAAECVKDVLLFALGCHHVELSAVASSIIATCAVSSDGVQPALYIRKWPQLIPALVHNMRQCRNPTVTHGSVVTVRKVMEDGPRELSHEQLDGLLPVLVQFLSSSDNDEGLIVSALQSIVACLAADLMPSALVAHFGDYLSGLSALASHSGSTLVRKWVCRSIVTLLSLRTEYVAPHMVAISQFMLKSTADISDPAVALEACEFWLTFASLQEEECTTAMADAIAKMLPQLIPVLLVGMVYLPEQQEELKFRNEMDMQENVVDHVRPVFHKSRSKGGDGYDSDDDDDDDDDMDDESNEWTLRKCSAASLDALAALYGPDPVLPCLLPELEKGLASSDPWVQEASILALGAIAEGCGDAMAPHMAKLFPFLMAHLAAPEAPNVLPQVKSTAAWTIGRYSSWAVEQVQSGAQGHLLAQMTEVFLARLLDKNRRVQVACCSAFGVVIESAGDLMVPYLEPVFQGLVSALSRYKGRSLLIVFDTFGIIADFVGAAIGEGTLPTIYIPALLPTFDAIAKNDPTDRTLLPLMESLSSIALVCGPNFQPYALETFDDAMCIIESVTMMLAATGDQIDNEEDADPIVCAADLLDGLVEGLGSNFASLVSSSTRYGQYFPSVLHALASHEIPGVRMSAFALLGDLAINAPSVLEGGLPELLQEAIGGLDPVHPSVCNNAVWAIGEVCVRCRENATVLEPFAPSLLHSLIALLMGNGLDGTGRGVALTGIAENAAATTGRLAMVNPAFIAADLPRFLLGWCEAMAKISDPKERRDAYTGFIRAIYANPTAMQAASANVADAISSILFAIVSWHMPSQDVDFVNIQFEPFPQSEAELGHALCKLVQDIKASVGDETWSKVQSQLPVNVRRLLREAYQL